jgi:transcriptional regulator with XRE-family HTH domain
MGFIFLFGGYLKNKILKMELARRGYSISYVAQRLGLRVYLFSLYLSGLRTMPDSMKDSASKFLGIPRNVLFDPSELNYFKHLAEH